MVHATCIQLIGTLNLIDNDPDKADQKPKNLTKKDVIAMQASFLKVEENLNELERNPNIQRAIAECLPRLEKMTEKVTIALDEVCEVEIKWQRHKSKLVTPMVATREAIKRTIKNIKDLRVEWCSCIAMVDSMMPKLEALKGDWGQNNRQGQNRQQQQAAAGGQGAQQQAPRVRWNAPSYSCETLKEAENPNSFKIWREQVEIWFDCGGEELPSTKVQYGFLTKMLPQEVRERIGTDPESGLHRENTLEVNLDIIEKYMLKAYPQNKRRLGLYNLIDHNNEIKFPDMVAKVRREMVACNYEGQTPIQILIALLISSCTEVNLIKYMADNTNTLSEMTVLEDFETALKTEQDRLEMSPAYPNYTGLGAKPPTKGYANINKVETKSKGKVNLPPSMKVDSEGKPPQWMMDKPCFKCGANGHTLHTCTVNVSKCGIDGCNKWHTATAHKQFKEYMANKGKNTGVKAVNTEDQVQAQGQNNQTTNNNQTNAPATKTQTLEAQVLEMQKQINDLTANNNEVTQNLRVHIYNEKTDGVIQYQQEQPENISISKLNSQVNCTDTLDESILKYIDRKLKMLDVERKEVLRQEEQDIMQIKKYILNQKNELEYLHNDGEIGTKRPYVPVKISCKANGMNINTKSLIDTGADKAVISSETVRKLNMRIGPTRTRARDAGGRPLPILGEVTLDFSCTCKRHKGKKQ